MGVKLLPQPPKLPVFLQRLSSDEYVAPPYSAFLRDVLPRVQTEGPKFAQRIGMSLADYWSGRQGTAAALRAVSEAAGGGFYNIPEEAALDRAAADEALGGDQLVIDVQTHFVSERADYREWNKLMVGVADVVSPDRFKGLDKIIRTQNQAGYSLAEYLRCIYLQSETAVAVLSSAPGAEGVDPMRMVTNAEMTGTRELIDRLSGTGRMINHCLVHPNVVGDLDKMDRWRDWCDLAGWKVYTQYGSHGKGPFKWENRNWMLDDEEFGEPFLRRVRDSGVKVICAHKGISAGSDTGWDGPASPKDIGPAAAAHPDIIFIVYHSGYEPKEGDEPEEGPYSEETSDRGVNRLVKSLKDHKIGPGGNVYCELGSTWNLIMANPNEAAHVMGKLLSAVGEDQILWGTDCIFYGSPQPLIEAFRAFQIPEEWCQRYGYPQLTATAKEKILGLNAARLYGLDPAKVRASTQNDDLAWVKAAMEEYTAKGVPSSV